MKLKDQIRAQILSASADGSKVEKLETQPAMMAKLREELQLPIDAAVVIEGVPITALSERDRLLTMAISYASIRWQILMTPDDVAALLKAVPDAELLDLIPIIVDQHFDDCNFEDPVDEYDVESVDAVLKALKEVGFVDVEI